MLPFLYVTYTHPVLVEPAFFFELNKQVLLHLISALDKHVTEHDVELT